MVSIWEILTNFKFCVQLTMFSHCLFCSLDKRVADWPLMQSPIPTVALILLYLSTVHFGPQIMKNRKPFQLRWVLVFYNLFMTFLNLYIAVEVCHIHSGTFYFNFFSNLSLDYPFLVCMVAETSWFSFMIFLLLFS